MSDLINLAAAYGDRFSTNVKATLVNMSPEKWIRIVLIVGAYMLLRPYLLKLGGRVQMRQHEKEAAEAEAEAAKQAQMSPNDLRGAVKIPDDSEDEGEATQATASDWGKKARRRQRHMVKKILEAEEQRLREQQEDEEDKDIQEFLIG